MTTSSKVLIAIVVIVASIVIARLIVLGFMSAEPLVGLLGVLIGGLISELSHRQSAREERKHQLRLAALDRRLLAHQEAFSLWRKLLKDLGDPAKIGDTVMKCQEWWDNNCLYLAPEARQAFAQSYLAASSYHNTLGTRDVELIKREYEKIKRAGNLIVQGVELPTISEGEDKMLKDSSDSDA